MQTGLWAVKGLFSEYLEAQKGGFGTPLSFKSGDRVLVSESEADVVESVEKAVLAEWVDLERVCRRRVVRYGLTLEIDGQGKGRNYEGTFDQLINLDFVESHGKQTCLEAVAVEDISEARRYNDAEPIVEQTPRSMLAR